MGRRSRHNVLVNVVTDAGDGREKSSVRRRRWRLVSEELFHDVTSKESLYCARRRYAQLDILVDFINELSVETLKFTGRLYTRKTTHKAHVKIAASSIELPYKHNLA